MFRIELVVNSCNVDYISIIIGESFANVQYFTSNEWWVLDHIIIYTATMYGTIMYHSSAPVRYCTYSIVNVGGSASSAGSGGFDLGIVH